WLSTPATWSAREVVQLATMLQRLARAVQASLERVGAERDRLDAVLANLADGVVMVDGTGRVVRLNPAAAQILRTPQQARGRTVAEVLRDHELVALVEQARSCDALPRVATRSSNGSSRRASCGRRSRATDRPTIARRCWC